MKKFVFIVLTIIFIGLLIFSYSYFQKMNLPSSSSDAKIDFVENQEKNNEVTDNTLIEKNEVIEATQTVTNITSSNFDESISQGVVLVDFYADWCGPCQMLSPIIDEIANEMTDIKFYRVDTDVEEQLSTRYRIMYLPTLVIFKDGEKVDESIGLISKEELIDFINNNK